MIAGCWLSLLPVLQFASLCAFLSLSATLSSPSDPTIPFNSAPWTLPATCSRAARLSLFQLPTPCSLPFAFLAAHPLQLAMLQLPTPCSSPLAFSAAHPLQLAICFFSCPPLAARHALFQVPTPCSSPCAFSAAHPLQLAIGFFSCPPLAARHWLFQLPTPCSSPCAFSAADPLQLAMRFSSCPPLAANKQISNLRSCGHTEERMCGRNSSAASLPRTCLPGGATTVRHCCWLPRGARPKFHTATHFAHFFTNAAGTELRRLPILLHGAPSPTASGSEAAETPQCESPSPCAFSAAHPLQLAVRFFSCPPLAARHSLFFSCPPLADALFQWWFCLLPAIQVATFCAAFLPACDTGFERPCSGMARPLIQHSTSTEDE